MPALPPRFGETPVKPVGTSELVETKLVTQTTNETSVVIKNDDQIKLGKLKPLNPSQGVHGLSLPLLSALTFMLLPLPAIFSLVSLFEPTFWESFNHLKIYIYATIFVLSIWWVANLTKSLWNIIVYRSKLAGFALFFTLLTPILWFGVWVTVGQKILSPILEIM